MIITIIAAIYDYYNGDPYDGQEVGDRSLVPSGGFKRWS